jgi:hypothetical protein
MKCINGNKHQMANAKTNSDHLVAYFTSKNGIKPKMKSASPQITCSFQQYAPEPTNKYGTMEMIIPFTNAPSTHPQMPPLALPNTPAVAPVKKCGTILGITTMAHVLLLGKLPAIPILIPKHIIPATIEAIKPIITAFGAKGNTTGQSTAGREPLINFSAIPLKAGVSSAINILTPIKITSTPAAKVKAITMPDTMTESELEIIPALIIACEPRAPQQEK